MPLIRAALHRSLIKTEFGCMERTTIGVWERLVATISNAAAYAAYFPLVAGEPAFRYHLICFRSSFLNFAVLSSAPFKFAIFQVLN